MRRGGFMCWFRWLEYHIYWKLRCWNWLIRKSILLVGKSNQVVSNLSQSVFIFGQIWFDRNSRWNGAYHPSHNSFCKEADSSIKPAHVIESLKLAALSLWHVHVLTHIGGSLPNCPQAPNNTNLEVLASFKRLRRAFRLKAWWWYVVTKAARVGVRIVYHPSSSPKSYGNDNDWS